MTVGAFKKIHCMAKEVFKWQFNGNSSFPSNSVLVDSKKTIILGSITKENNGTYECIGIKKKTVFMAAANVIVVSVT